MEVNVWVNNREKKVKGLTKRTTCHDVITALLYNKTKADKLADDFIESYVLIEQWRECERVLPRNTKIIKIWRAWHNEQTNVKFILRKKTKEDKPTKNGKQLSKPKEIPERIPRKRRSGEKNNRRARSVERSDQQENVKWLNEQNSHRISRSNDELLDNEPYPSPSSLAYDIPPTSDRLIELVIGQEEQLHNLIATIEQTDLEIEYYETQMHVCRMYANGRDYVQESYLATTTGENEELALNESEQCPPMVSGGYETQPPESLQKNSVINQCVLDSPTDDKDGNEVRVTQSWTLRSEKANDKLRAISNVTYGSSIAKTRKHVTFAKLDSEGNRICADSVESLNDIGVEKRNAQITTGCIMPTCYETSQSENSHSSIVGLLNETGKTILHNEKTFRAGIISCHPTKADEPLNRLNCESETRGKSPNDTIKGILLVNNNKPKMAIHQLTEPTIWDQKCDDTDSSSDTGLSSMQDSEDGGAVHFASVTLV